MGELPPERLAALYGSADAFILPTLLESFGRPYHEAMQFDLPILTADRDFARERCQDAAIYFDPLDANSMARSMAQVIDDAALRVRLVENAKRLRGQEPTWDEIASRFVDVLERAAGNQLSGADKANTSCEKQYARVRARHSSAGDALPENLSPSRLPSSVTSTRTEPVAMLAASDVRTYFNREAHSWQRKYRSRGRFSSRVEQFVAQLSRLCLPENNILDLGCGTGELAAAINKMGYHITACDIAEGMIDIARTSHAKTGVKWICLEPDWKALPFEDGSFGGVVASSVFEYLIDVEHVVAELSRVLQPGGILLMTVPNPLNLLRKLETWLQPLGSSYHLSSLLHRIERIDSYTSYLQLSRNRFGGNMWESVLSSAQLVALNNRDFSKQAWLDQANASLILLAVKKAETGQYQLV
jgi:ubiquinone/menaquinone biosynthesis C-methylase UbiE